MRAVVQRVTQAKVTVNGDVVGAIEEGLVVLVGVMSGDSASDARTVADKLTGLRIFPDGEGAMNRSLCDIGGSVLLVSQFTLYADARKGRRPSFVTAAPPDIAEPLIGSVVARLEESGVPVESGRFGAMMDVEIVNHGPVTIILETRDGRMV